MLSIARLIRLFCFIYAVCLIQLASAQVATEWHRMSDLPEGRNLPFVVSLGNRLMAIGSLEDNVTGVDGAYSDDLGKTWHHIEHFEPQTGDYNYIEKVFSRENTLWVAGQSSGENLPPFFVVYSHDGVTWQNLPISDPAFGPILFGPIEYNHQIFSYGSGSTSTAVYLSTDTLHWSSTREILNYEPRYGQKYFILNDQLYLTGGSEIDPPFDLFFDVWRSADGYDWEKVVDTLPTYLGREFVSNGTAVYDFGGPLFLSQAYTVDSLFTVPSPVYKSTDFVHWDKVMDNPPYPVRYLPGVGSFKDRLWRIGGATDYGGPYCELSKEVWWTPASPRRLQVPPGTIQFGPSLPGTGPIVRPVHLVNASTQTVQLLNVQLTGATADQFTFVGSPDLAPLPPLTTRTLQVAFNPTTRDQQINELVFTTDLDGETTVPVSLVAGPGAYGHLDISTTTLNFGVSPTQQTVSRLLTLTNTGTTTTLITQWFLDSDYSVFNIRPAANGVGLPIALKPGTSVDLLISYAPQPTSAGVHLARLAIKHLADNTGPFVVNLTGQVDPAVLEVGPTRVDFGTRAPGSGPSSPQSVTLRNTGPSPLIINSLTLLEPTATHYFKLLSTTTLTLAPNSERVYPVIFDAGTTPGLRTATLRFSTLVGTTDVALGGLCGNLNEPGLEWTPFATTFDQHGRVGAGGLYMNSQFRILAGFDGQTLFNDVWQSPDLVQWNRLSEHTPFSARRNFGCVEFNNKMWVIGGYDGTIALADVWCSADGIQWTTTTSHAAFGPRASTGCAVYHDKLWLIGGGDSLTSSSNAVWTSPDGATWSALPTPPFPARRNPVVLPLNNRLFVLGGEGHFDGWYTDDGTSWTQTWGVYPMNNATMALGVVFMDKIWLAITLPGSSEQLKARTRVAVATVPTMQIWNSSDGLQWHLVADGIAPGALAGANLLTDGTSLFLMNGFNSQGVFNPTIWRSTALAPTAVRHWTLLE